MKKNNIIIKTGAVLILLLGSTLQGVFAQKERPAHLGFIYPISTNGIEAVDYTNNFSLHALAGLSGGESGVAIYGLGGMIKGNATGFQVAGLWLHLSGNLNGLQVAGLMNQARDATNGVQIAGIVNLLTFDSPVQIAGIFNRARNVSGFQSAGIANLSVSNSGAQVAGIANLSQTVDGIQIAGIFNQAENVKGSQIAGILNRAKKVDGIQLSGLINIADSSDYPIGIINLIENGERRISLSTDENLTTMVSFKSGGTKLYGIIGLGSNLQYDNLPYALEAGLGIKLLEGNTFRLDMEASNMFVTNFKRRGEYSRSGLRLLPILQLSRSVQIFAGPGLNYMHTKYSEAGELSGLQLWERQKRGIYRSIHLGFSAGVQIRLD